MFRCGVDINLCGEKGVSLFLIVCWNGYFKIVEVLFSEEVDFNLCEEDGVSLFFWVC